MKSVNSKRFMIFSIFYYLIFTVLMILGTVFDLSIGKAVYNPENFFAGFMEDFGQFVYWAMWGPALTVIFLCRRDLNENLNVIGKVFPFICPIKNTDGKLYRICNFCVKLILTAGYFVLVVVGWKKLIENVTKNILLNIGKENLSAAAYFAISAAVAVAGIVLFRRINPKTLKKLEAIALAGVLFSILCKLTEECKPITQRVRFREMVAYSNGFLNENGLSEGKLSPLNASMVNGTDFSAFSPWYKIGNDMGIYSRADSFPSGHTLYSVTPFISYFFFTAFEKVRKFLPLALCMSFIYVILMCYTRMVMGAHYLTDVASAALLGYTFFLLAKAAYEKTTQKGIIG